ncbi:LOW QUALITY PROTEIN: MLO-like protein 4 [Dioscorea cayenensis subsp. rotundata]|uniref:MLO-like protein n=1 Tax=Dioscorea cayennensis subsp. rotundata TaxID=55577 RepID=A0AB40C2D7_DIOCR|nr:LOW QUALITY PROTEIN: MLO-like protein 4 [Dioscorea cayenensis subsp. rotundata]
MGEGRSLAETPTWSVATVTTVMVAVCFLVERSISRFAKWLKKTKRKAMLAALEKIREELMLLGLISLMLSQTARWISEICVPSSLFSSRFYICSEGDFTVDDVFGSGDQTPLNHSTLVGWKLQASSQQCGPDREPFVSFEGLEQLHIFLFILGITHVLYSCITVALSMIKIYSWRKWENQVYPSPNDNLQARRSKMMKRQSTFVFHHASHPWSKSRILIWMLCFIRQFKGSITKSDYMALRLGFITNHKLPPTYNFHKYMVRSMEDEFHGSVGISWPLWIYAIVCIFINIHGLNIYFWLAFVPAILVMLVGTKLQHVVAQLALEVVEPTGPFVGTQLKPRDGLFWFRKPEILLWLIQFISFQNAFEMATFIWSLFELSAQSCFMKNHGMIAFRLFSGLFVQFWCSYSTLPLNVIITQMGSKFKKSLLAENIRESLHSWCRRVKEKSRRGDPADRSLARLETARSTCSLGSTIYETDETNTVASGQLSRSLSVASLDDLAVVDCINEPSVKPIDDQKV